MLRFQKSLLTGLAPIEVPWILNTKKQVQADMNRFFQYCLLVVGPVDNSLPVWLSVWILDWPHWQKICMEIHALRKWLLMTFKTSRPCCLAPMTSSDEMWPLELYAVSNIHTKKYIYFRMQLAALTFRFASSSSKVAHSILKLLLAPVPVMTEISRNSTS